ncbi:MAG: T9SS type A sorting domain-containing protein [Flavobacteriales bacterium]|nr:MAG: T9SS type A sorting domain-containing protein [Flavobacteriales bacterium]
MRTAISIAGLLITLTCPAQYLGGTGGGGATNCSAAFAMLPVELLHFTVKVEGEHVLLSWATATELNNAGFHVERSSDGLRFEPIAEVEGMGTTQQLTSYETVDRAPLRGLSFYRLRQTDHDGTTMLSEVVAVEVKTAEAVAYPNPVQDLLHLAGLEPGAIVEVIDPLGRVIHAERSTAQLLTIQAARWPAGRYTARVVAGSGTSTIGIIRH